MVPLYIVKPVYTADQSCGFGSGDINTKSRRTGDVSGNSAGGGGTSHDVMEIILQEWKHKLCGAGFAGVVCRHNVPSNLWSFRISC